MTYASVLDPYPMWVNGYFCLDGSEGKLARKSVDPGNPKPTPENSEAATAASAAASKTTTVTTNATNGTIVTRPVLDPAKVNAAQKAAEAKQEPVSGYTPSGNTSTAPTPGGQVYSVKA